MIDSHTHIWKPDDIDGLEAIRQAVGAARVGIASVAKKQRINDNPVLLATKARYPDRYYLFLGLDHSAYWSQGAISTPTLAEQIERMILMGADGLKLIETKPTYRKQVDIPIDSDYYDEMFGRVEAEGLPIVWHVADPEEFWDPELCPGWAKDAGWFYDETFVTKEQLYAEVENVLVRHPRLKVVFAHFYFLSADLQRAGAFLDRFPNTHFDLAPGVEMLYNMSRDPDSDAMLRGSSFAPNAREFFIKYSDRIVFGTDNVGDQPIEQAMARTRMVSRWLESADEFTVDPAADALLGESKELIRGLALPQDALGAIYQGNFARLAGPQPKPLDRSAALEECRRMKEEEGESGAVAGVISECIRRLQEK